LGLSPNVSPALADFLRQQGYLTEVGVEARQYAYYFDQVTFSSEEQRPLLDHLENTDCPLARLGRWPNAARSALSITGDIDCFDPVDYLARFLSQ